MIALVRVSAPAGAGSGIAEIGSLPEPPGCGYTAFAVHCRGEGEVRETLLWYRLVLDSRPGAPLGLIACATDCIQPIAELDHSLTFVLDPGELNGGGLPAGALEALRNAGIEGRILQEIVNEHGPEVFAEQGMLRAVIARAVSGGTLGRAARDLGVHPDTLARWLKSAGLSPRLLRQGIRMRAFELRVELGMERGVALGACGWTHQGPRRRALGRLR